MCHNGPVWRKARKLAGNTNSPTFAWAEYCICQNLRIALSLAWIKTEPCWFRRCSSLQGDWNTLEAAAASCAFMLINPGIVCFIMKISFSTLGLLSFYSFPHNICKLMNLFFQHDLVSTELINLTVLIFFHLVKWNFYISNELFWLPCTCISWQWCFVSYFNSVVASIVFWVLMVYFCFSSSLILGL